MSTRRRTGGSSLIRMYHFTIFPFSLPLLSVSFPDFSFLPPYSTPTYPQYLHPLFLSPPTQITKKHQSNTLPYFYTGRTPRGLQAHVSEIPPEIIRPPPTQHSLPLLLFSFFSFFTFPTFRFDIHLPATATTSTTKTGTITTTTKPPTTIHDGDIRRGGRYLLGSESLGLWRESSTVFVFVYSIVRGGGRRGRGEGRGGGEGDAAVFTGDAYDDNGDEESVSEDVGV